MTESAVSDVYSDTVDTPNMESLLTSLVNAVLSKLPDANDVQKRELFNLFSDLTNSAMRDLKYRFKTYAERCSDFFQQGAFKKNADTFKTNVLCVERLMMHHFRERSKSVVVDSSYTNSGAGKYVTYHVCVPLPAINVALFLAQARSAIQIIHVMRIVQIEGCERS